MRRVGDFPLWIGTARDARDMRAVLNAGIEAVVDLAMDEPPITPTRELVYLRFPLVDGGGNPAWLLAAAVHAVDGLIGNRVPTLVACGGGMSRSVAVAGAGLWFRNPTGWGVGDALAVVRGQGPADVHPELWRGICQTVFTVSEASFYSPTG